MTASELASIIDTTSTQNGNLGKAAARARSPLPRSCPTCGTPVPADRRRVYCRPACRASVYKAKAKSPSDGTDANVVRREIAVILRAQGWTLRKIGIGLKVSGPRVCRILSTK
jgi:hypothetical protein